MGWGLPGILRYLPHPTIAPTRQIKRTLDSLPPGSKVLDVGAGGRRIVPGVVTFDAMPGTDVDIVGDIHNLPIPGDSFDCIFCTGTLEHVRDRLLGLFNLIRFVRVKG